MRAIQLRSLSFFYSFFYSFNFLFYLLLIVVLLFSGLARAQTTDSSTSAYAERFETAWRLVNERYWDSDGIEALWQDARIRYEADALAAENDEAYYAVMELMYDEIGDNHSTFVPPAKVEEIRVKYGDLACIGIFSQNNPENEVEEQRVQHSPEYESELTYLGNIGYYLSPEKIGYISLPDLATDFVAKNLRNSVQVLQEEGATAFILDMRDNGGGKLVELLQAAGIFTQGFILRNITRWTFPIPMPAVGVVETDLPLVILINDNVHSAAEGLAGALEVTERATLIGQTTAGNVEALLPFCFRDGSQAWVATGVLAPIRGATWEGRGVEPDIEVDPETALQVAIDYLRDKLSE